MRCYVILLLSFCLLSCNSPDEELVTFRDHHGGDLSVSENGYVHSVDVVIDDPSDASAVFLASSNASRLLSVRIQGSFCDADVKLLSKSKSIKFIYLNSDSPHFTMSCLNNWASPRLEKLHFKGAHASEDGIAGTLFLVAEKIQLESCELNDLDFKSLSNAKYAKTLSLDDSVKQAGKLDLIGSLGNVQELYLNGCNLDLNDASVICGMPALKKLQVLESRYPDGFIDLIERKRPDIRISY